MSGVQRWKITSMHRNANAALTKHHEDAGDSAGSQKDMINITVECEESDIITDSGGDHTYYANFNAIIMRTIAREVTIQGPQRDSKPEAIKDSEVLGKAYQLEGEAGVKRVAQRLERKRWTRQEMLSSSEKSLEGLMIDPTAATGVKSDKLIPPGEGWTRFDDEMLWDPRSKVYFAQVGSRMGQYLVRDAKNTKWQEVDIPHSPVDALTTGRGGGANIVRKGAKLERTVLLNELPKIARLALKFPLSFLDNPASAYALFQGVRTAEAADWCAKNFHTKLIPALAAKIHHWDAKELEDLLSKVLKELDAELLKGANAFSGCTALVALLLGDRLVVSGVGQMRVVVLYEDGSTRQLLGGTHDLKTDSERERVEAALGIIHGGCLHKTVPEGLDDAQRILRSRSSFEVLQIETGGPSDEKQVRTAYRKLALRVHPDKVAEGDKELFNKAFARIEKAQEDVQNMLSEDAEACRVIHRVLRAEVHTREGAAELLSVDKAATTDTDQVATEAEKSSKKIIKSFEKMEGPGTIEYKQAVAICQEAVETLRRQNSPEALPRQEALLKINLATSRCMGARDMRFPSPIVRMEPESTSWIVPCIANCRVALLAGATTALDEKRLVSSTTRLKGKPKASSLRWCQEADPSASSVGAACIRFETKRKKDDAMGSAAKRQKTAAGPDGAFFLRHILFRHQQLKVVDPSARREGASKTLAEAEAAALDAVEKLQDKKELFLKMCKDLSDCQTAEQPGNLAGHLGWVGRGEQEVALEEAAFCLDLNEFSDIVTTSRGVHILQRLG